MVLHTLFQYPIFYQVFYKAGINIYVIKINVNITKMKLDNFHLLINILFQIRDVVLSMEESLAQIESLTGFSCFPITKKHSSSSPPSERQKPQHDRNEKENISPISTQSTTSRTNNIARQLGSYESSALSNASTNSRQRRPLIPCQQININNMKNASCEQKVDCGTFYKVNIFFLFIVTT